MVNVGKMISQKKKETSKSQLESTTASSSEYFVGRQTRHEGNSRNQTETYPETAEV